MTELNMFKIEYDWFEGEHRESLLINEVSKEGFEKDILEAKEFAEKLKGVEIKEGEFLGKGYNVKCLPEFYQQIIWFLIEKKGYQECQFDSKLSYIVDDTLNKEISVERFEKIMKKSILNDGI
jgi:hypothetical protein